VDSPIDDADDGTNDTGDLANGTGDLTNGTDVLTNDTDPAGVRENSTGDLGNATGNLANATDELTNATNSTRRRGNAVGGLANLTETAESLEGVSTIDARGRLSVTGSSLTGTVSGTLDGDLAVASDPPDEFDSSRSSDSTDGSRESDGAGTGPSTASDGTTEADDGSSGGDAGASAASDRPPTRGECGGSAGGTELVVEFGALTAAALVPQLADGLAILVNAGGVPVSSAAAGSTFGIRRTLRSRFDRFWRFVAPFRYSRWDDSDPLDDEVRAALYEAIDRSPGAYLSAVAEQADVALSTARHHLDVLEDEGLVTTAKVRGKRRYYPDHAPDVELTAALEDEGTREVLRALARLGASHGGWLADELERDASTISHHLSRLEDAGLVEREREGRAVVNRLAPEARAVLRGDGESDGDADAETPAVAD
jgi:DNA-binding transcriptional ArsR family regulator